MSTWSAESPIRCPHCAHRFGFAWAESPELSFWEKIGLYMGIAPKQRTFHLIEYVNGRYEWNNKQIPFDFMIECARCHKTATFQSWSKCGFEPIIFIEHWNNMCECGGEFWAEATSDEKGVVMECDRCGAIKGHSFKL